MVGMLSTPSKPVLDAVAPRGALQAGPLPGAKTTPTSSISTAVAPRDRVTLLLEASRSAPRSLLSEPRPRPASANPISGRATVPILEIGGFHGYLEPYRNPEVSTNGLVGGAPALTSLLRLEKGRTGEALIISGGDFFQGPPLATVFEGRPVIEFMNQAGYDCMTLGNHDFDLGVDVLAARLAEARFPALAANLVDAKSGRPVWESENALHMVAPYHVADVDGARVAVVGLMKPETPLLTSPDNVKSLRWKPIPDTLADVLPGLVETERPDLIVLHCQHIQLSDQILAQARDILRAGHFDHEPALVFMGGHNDSEHAHAAMTENGVIVQGTDRGAELNATRIKLDLKRHRIMAVDHADIPVLASAIEPDPAVAGIVARYKQRLGQQFARRLGKTTARLARSRHADGALGNVVTEAMRQRMKADVAFLAGGSMKADIEPGYVTVGATHESLPFHNQCVLVEMTGRQLTDALEKSAARPSGDKVLQMSGATMVYDSSRPVGQRVLSAAVNGLPVEPDRLYRVAIDDFLAGGGDFFSEFTAARRVESGPLVRDVFQQYCRHSSPIEASADGRIKDVSSSA